ncbi:hypothetical protein ACFRQM_44425 [Streptomyces sp. NPDC056831]|uniref:hypothetical protein n=1 Tax=Streptomyces sp. NPDC056831 TaxID=3345954 RepID=UPI0036ABD10B
MDDTLGSLGSVCGSYRSDGSYGVSGIRFTTLPDTRHVQALPAKGQLSTGRKSSHRPPKRPVRVARPVGSSTRAALTTTAGACKAHS